MNRSLLVAHVVLGCVLLAAGCGEATRPSGDEAPASLDGAWELEGGTVLDGEIEPVDGHRITLSLEGDRVGGSSGCNSYGGSARIDGDRIRVDELGSTEIGCEPPVMAAEAAFVEALQRVERIRRSGDELVLTGPTAELRFERVPRVAATELVGTTWELETVLAGETASTPPLGGATLQLQPGGALEGATGCRSFTGTYVVRGDEVVVTRLSLRDDPLAGRCAPAGEEQEALVVEALGDGFRPEVDGDRLTIRSSGGGGLVYRAR